MKRKLANDTYVTEDRPFAQVREGDPTPIMETPVIRAGEVVELNVDWCEPDSVCVTWRGRRWVMDKSDWDAAEVV
jgi:hypothetical protein